MTKTLKDLRPVYVVGAGWHRYQPLTETTFVTLGLAAVRGALADAGIPYAAVESAFVATALLPMAPGRPILRHLGASGIELVHIENASASSSAAFRKACIEVASGLIDVALVLGVDKPSQSGPRGRAERLTGIGNLADDAIVPFTHFALLADQYAQRWGVDPDDVARVAVKNHGNGAKNPRPLHERTRVRAKRSATCRRRRRRRPSRLLRPSASRRVSAPRRASCGRGTRWSSCAGCG